MRSPWPAAIPPTAAAATSGSPGPWSTRCPTPWPPSSGRLSEWRATLIVRESRLPRRRRPPRAGRRTVRRPRQPGGQGRQADRRRRQGHRLPTRPARRRRPRRPRRKRTLGTGPPRPRQHDLCDRAAAHDPGRRRSTPRSSAPPTPAATAAPAARSWPTPSSNASPADPPTCPSPSRSTWSSPTTPCSAAAPSPARLTGYGPVPAAVARHLVTDAAADTASTGDPAPALPPPRLRSVGGHGIPGTAVSPRAWRVHRPPRRHLPHPVLRRPHPPHRPRRPGHAAADPPPPQRPGHCARATTPRKHPAGRWATTATATAPTPRVITPTGAPHCSQHHRYPAAPALAAASSKSPSPTTSPGTTPA